MATGIGGVACDLLKGHPKPMTEQVQEWSVVGLDGHGFQKIGKRGVDETIQAIRFAAGATIETWYAALYALEATTVTYENDDAIVSGNVYVVNVGPLTKQRIIQNGSLTYRGECSIVVKPVA
jgi:hypothetical protein